MGRVRARFRAGPGERRGGLQAFDEKEAHEVDRVRDVDTSDVVDVCRVHAEEPGTGQEERVEDVGRVRRVDDTGEVGVAAEESRPFLPLDVE